MGFSTLASSTLDAVRRALDELVTHRISLGELEVQADLDDGPAQVREQLVLAHPDYVTYLSTDRPMYRPGEVVPPD